MDDEHVAAGAMPDNARIRAAMAAFAENPTTEEADSLMLTLMREKFVVLVPMAEAPDGSRSFTTVVQGDPHPILHVYTTLEEMPELEEDVDVYLFPYVDLILDMLQGEERWNGLIVDPRAAHSITEYFPSTGGHALYSTVALRIATELGEPGLN